MKIPDRLIWLKRHETGAAWIVRLPKLVSELTEMWGLRLEAPYEGANVSWVAPAIRDAKRVVLKIQWPHEECAREADTLKAWDGIGAVRLLAHDPERHALLLEHCSPGVCLAAAPDIDPLGVLIRLLPDLWTAAGAPFKSLREEAMGWAAADVR